MAYPSTPSVGDEYITPQGVVKVWTGLGWRIKVPTEISSSTIPVVPTGNLQSDNLQDALVEIQTDLDALVPPPLDTFIDGWSFFAIDQIEDVITTGAVHAAVSFGPQTPTINGVPFDAVSADIGDTAIPNNAGGWSGTNWLVQRATFAPTPPTIGNNAGRTETTPFVDLPDPSFGGVAGLEDLCAASLRRNFYTTISNLTVGNRYYAAWVYGTYPNALTNACVIEPGTGDALQFSVDGVGAILEKGIRRFGWTAASTDQTFLKFGPDNNGAHCNALVIINEGAP